ncbi:ABC transporter ATP-binding protein [Kibdelosporangium persicum]|uniref:ABC-type multidrug transport system, ATPase and permease component n=1 Tax=Kibdelosporangium persicum TaxID=2698649 RepID=A0ABX2FDL0_9PSEU|nr:ABC transporter ATP-binding protein [Kibdelosporangium persicum]NRN69454.1 ABC-type multidrug transport system, ATPase and permease component [Kibdelosporangium persicum]
MAHADDALFGSVRGRIRVIAALSLLGAVTAVVPFIAIVELARTLWPALDGGVVDTARAWTIVVVAVAALVVSFAAAATSGVVSHLADADMQLDVRRRIVRQLRALPLGWFGARSSGAVKKAAENDVSALHHLVAHAIQEVITAVAMPALALAYLFTVEWRMALACLLPLVLTVVLYSVMMRGGQEKYAEYDASVVRLNAATIEYVHGIAVVKSFGQAGRGHRRYREETSGFVRFYDGWMRETSVAAALIELVTSPVIVLVYLCAVGAWLTGAGAVAPVDVLPALLLGVGLTGPVLQLGFTSQFLRNASRARASLLEFFRQPAMPQPADPVEPAASDVALADVSFSYDGNRAALSEITAACAPGTVTALVGPSGSGKSTLARLVPRFHDVTGGAVRLGGADVRDIAADRLYAEIGFVFQDAHLLRTTVRDNIRLTRPGADDDAVTRAARAAQIHDRILRLPRGYDSVIGQDAHLSGGEAQRLTIARALLTDAPILVLDEATAFADPDSEAAIQTALSALAADRLLLVIAHRLHTITGAGQILVLAEGRIAERGTHAELAAAGGLYQSMWERYEKARAATTPGVVS